MLRRSRKLCFKIIATILRHRTFRLNVINAIQFTGGNWIIFILLIKEVAFSLIIVNMKLKKKL